ncbi:hypothetical protein [Tolypothrix sp. VBCCA 56010]|uniref:hypothetical protein n=1 Tax=Tolypothrix sp. VBCCA 56010 TaxID=3137731 RepID=UPI003D7E2FAE
MMTNLEINKRKQKYLGECLIEAGLITPSQLETALKEQNSSGRHLQEILTKHGWIKQQTIEYFLEKIVLPEQLTANKKQLDQNKNSIEQISHAEWGGSDSAQPLTVSLRKFAINLSPKNTLRVLFLVILSLCLVSLAGQFSVYFLPEFPLRGFFAAIFYIDYEQNIPAVYSASALLFCSVLLLIIAHAKKVAGELFVRHWTALSIIFLYLSGDEFMSLHERLIDPLRKTLNTSGFLYYAWVIPGAIFILICLLAFLSFLAALPAKTRYVFLIAGTIFVFGAIGTELVGGYYAELHGQQNIIYVIITTIEEFLEMLGIAVFIYALLSYISTYMKGMALRINIINDNKQRQNAELLT